MDSPKSPQKVCSIIAFFPRGKCRATEARVINVTEYHDCIGKAVQSKYVDHLV